MVRSLGFLERILYLANAHRTGIAGAVRMRFVMFRLFRTFRIDRQIPSEGIVECSSLVALEWTELEADLCGLNSEWF